MDVMSLNTDPGEYFIKGHGHSDENILVELKNHIRKPFTLKTKKESWCHWCYGINYSIDTCALRYVLVDDKYKGVRGGFPITVVNVDFHSK